MSKDQLRIMWASNAPWCGSGYGMQSMSLLPRFNQLPEVDKVSVFAWFGLQGGMLQGGPNGSIAIYPMGLDLYGNDMYEAHASHFKADLLVTLIDAWVLKPLEWELPSYTRWAAWYPVDHDPIPRAVLDVVRAADYPITYAKFGHQATLDAGLDNTYIPHGVETDIFKVQEPEQVQAFRDKVCEGAAWLGVMIAANKGWPSRKGFEETLLAFRQILPDLPKPAILYIHADHQKTTGGGDLAALVKSLGLTQHVRFPDRYLLWIGHYTPSYLSMIYNAADLLINPSKGEGFGIPIIEAQACGTPVVVTRFSSMPELVKWGIATEPARLMWTPMESWQAVPDVQGIANAIMDIWHDRHGLTKDLEMEKRLTTSQAIHQEYGWDALVDQYWRPFFHRIIERNGGKPYGST